MDKSDNRIAKAQQIVKGQPSPPMATKDRRTVQHAPRVAVQKTPVKPGTSR